MAGTSPPQMGGLQAVTQPSGLLTGGAQIAQALGNIPALLNNQRVQRQQVEQQQQVQALQMEAQKAKVGDQLYAQIADIVVADPTKANDPKLLERAQRISKLTGRPIATRTDDHGNTVLDVDALRPGQDWESLTPQQRVELGIKLIAEPRDARAGLVGKMKNVPQDILDHDQVIQPSAGMVTQTTKALDDDVKLLSSGHLDPVRFAGNLRAKAGLYKSLGIDTSQYLTEDFLNAGVSSFAQSQVDWLKSKGIHMANEDALRERIANDRRTEVFARLKFDEKKLAEHTAEFKQKEERLWKTHEDTLSTALSNLNLRAGALDERIHNDAFMRQLGTVGALSKMTGDLRSQYNAAQTQYATTIRAIGTLGANGSSVPESMRKLADGLQARLGELGPQLDGYETIIRNASGRLQSGTAGVPVRPIPKPVATAGQPGTGKTLTKAQVIEIGKQKGWTVEEAVRQAQGLGYTVK